MTSSKLHNQLTKNKLNKAQQEAIKGGYKEPPMGLTPIRSVSIRWDDVVIRFNNNGSTKGTITGSSTITNNRASQSLMP